MNIMNVNNTAFTAKIPARINIKTKNPALQESTKEYFSELMKLRKETAGTLISKLEYLGKTVNLYFRGNEVVGKHNTNAVYINAGGPRTSRFDFEQAKDGEDLLNTIIKNIDLNA